MRKILVWSAVFIMIVAVVLTSERSWAVSQARKFMEHGADLMEKKHYDQAIASFKQAVHADPNSAETYNLLGMAYRHKYNQAPSRALKNQEITAFQKAIEVDPNNWVALINLGATYYYMGEKAKAAPLFKKALSLNPNHPEKAELEKMIQEGEKKP
jgi:tetratricopeptide (TPR) repeat protein